MMTFHHVEQLDRAVRVACEGVRCVATDTADRADELAGYVYRHWYLSTHDRGPRSSRRTSTSAPAVSARTWQCWSPLWTPETGLRGSELVRLYLSCRADTALQVAGTVTTAARSWAEPWRFTSTAVASSDPRPHETVLYLPLGSLNRLRGDLRDLLARLEPLLGPDTPALTLRVAPGAALAQNPPDDREFGEHRCALVARSVLENPTSHHHEQVERVTRGFADAGIDPDRPYREARSPGWDSPWRYV